MDVGEEVRLTEHQRKWLGRVQAGPIAIVECGAGSAVPTVRMFSQRLCSLEGTTLVRINPREPEIPDPERHLSLPVGALEALRAIDERVSLG